MNDKYIQQCRKMVLQKVNKTAADKWTDRELSALADNIFELSKIKLSITTLKRFFGIINYSGKPTLATKNAFAIYLGYQDWADFLQEEFSLSTLDYALLSSESNTSRQTRNKKIIIGAVIISMVVIGFVSTWISFDKKKTSSVFETIDTNLLQLSIEPSSGLTPLDFSVNVNTDTILPDRLHLFVEQHGTFPIHGKADFFSFKYLYPGKYKIHLRDNKQKSLLSKEVYASTDGWQGMVYRVPNTLYTNDLYAKPTVMSFPDPIIEKLDNEGTRYYITYNNFTAFPVQDKGLRLNTRIRNKGADFTDWTGSVYICLFFDQGEVKPGFINKGLTRYLKLVMADTVFNHKTMHLAAFEKAEDEWIEATISIKNQTINVFRSDSLILSYPYNKRLGNLHGIQYFFVGNGEVDYVKLWDEKDSLIINDRFD